jgi:hypothetical protein
MPILSTQQNMPTKRLQKAASMEDYQAEVAAFLASVEEKQIEAEKVANELANTSTTSKIVENVDDNGSKSADDDTGTDSPTTTEVAGTTKTKKPRFIWKYAVVKQIEVGKVKTTVNPFLDDDNLQDLYFSEKLHAVAPYKAKRGQKDVAITSMVNDLIKTSHSDGTMPLQKLTDYAVTSRLTAYLSLAEQWSDKTGPVFANGESPGEDMQAKAYSNMTIKEKILHNVEDIIEEHACMKNEATKKNDEKVEELKRQDTGVCKLMTMAMGNIESRINAAATEQMQLPNEVLTTPFTKPPGPKKLKSSNWTPYDVAVDSLERASRSDISSSEERIRVQEQRDKNKHAESMKRLDLEKERHEADMQFRQEQAARDDAFRMEQLQLQKETVAMQKQQSDVMRLLLETLAKK